MYKELNRLATFSQWKGNANVRPLQLARNGFYYSHSSDETICFSCDLRIGGCNEQHNPVEQHRHLSPNCPLITGTETRNIPLAACTLAPEPPTPQGGSERLMNVSCNSIDSLLRSALNRANARKLHSSNFTCRIDRSNPDFVQLRHETVRLGTFDDWPSTAHSSPMTLAREGFFYTGIDDRVQCAFCRGFLRKWQPADYPSQEHSKHYPSCSFVRGLDVGNVPASANSAVGTAANPIVRDQRLLTGSEYFNPETAERQAQEPRILDQGVLRSNQDFNELIDFETRMNVAAVRAILDMGFSRDLVKRIVENKLSMTGSDFQSAESLLDAIFLVKETTNFHNDGSPSTASIASSSSSLSSSAAASQAASATTTAAMVISSSSSAVSSADTFATSQSVDDRVTSTIDTATGLTSLMSRHSWRDSGIFSSSSSFASSPTVGLCSSLQLPLVNASSPSVAASESHALAPILSGAFPASAVATTMAIAMPTIPEVGTSCPTKHKAKRKRNKKKTTSSTTLSNKDLEQSPSTNRKPGEEAARRDVEREEEEEREMEEEPTTGAPADDESLKYLEENRQLKKARTCKVCMDSEVDTVFLPCGHLVCCRSCSPQLRNCPICRTFIRGTVKTSLS